MWGKLRWARLRYRVPMIQVEFLFADIEWLERQRFTHPHPWVQRKLEALYLKSQDLPHRTICQLCRICGNTLRSYLRDYQAGGRAQLVQVPFHRPLSALTLHQGELFDELTRRPAASVKEAAARIAQRTGLRRGLTQVRRFLHRLGLKYRKVAAIPAKADPAAQAAFKAQQLEPALTEARAGQRAVFFVDAAHFVLGPFLGWLWSLSRVFVRAPAGRQRFNVLGALNALTHELVTVTNETYITAQSVCELLGQLAQRAGRLPVTLVLDNARYQRCALVQQRAQALGIQLLYLPAYSPNLNLIERLWKFVKKRCLNSQYYANFESFKAGIVQCLSQVPLGYQEELDSLLTLQFQTFANAQPMAA